jgi:catechol 2,3-dioxygenase-like lactoylglutathione lyase family enzyme
VINDVRCATHQENPTAKQAGKESSTVFGVFDTFNDEHGRSSAQTRRRVDLSSTAREGELHLEVAIIPVSDVDRAKQFYERLGWRLDDDVAPMDGLRIVQFTPPGSACSVTFGLGITTAAPGSAGSTLTTSDIVSAHKDLVSRGINVVDVWHGPPFPVQARQPGPDPERTSYGSFCAFSDPDGNAWIVQEVTTRHPGRD